MSEEVVKFKTTPLTEKGSTEDTLKRPAVKKVCTYTFKCLNKEKVCLYFNPAQGWISGPCVSHP